MRLSPEVRKNLLRILRDKDGIQSFIETLAETYIARAARLEVGLEAWKGKDETVYGLAKVAQTLSDDVMLTFDLLHIVMLNHVELRDQVADLAEALVKVDEVQGEVIERVVKDIRETQKDVKDFKQHEDILDWIKDYVAHSGGEI